jgi:hypothetical protein
MNRSEDSYGILSDAFGVEIQHSIDTDETSSILTEGASARETLQLLEAEEKYDAIADLEHAVHEVSSTVIITRSGKNGVEELTDLFSAPQILEMAKRINDYLGTNIDDHIKNGSRPPGYQFLIDRLSMYYLASDRSVTEGFGRFEQRHSDPLPNAYGPRQQNSRQYAAQANAVITRNLREFYQSDFDVQLIGPTKIVNANAVWERGIAECQFLVLDYVSSQVALGFDHKVRLPKSEIAMTIDEIAANITALVAQRRIINDKTRDLNPFLAEQINRSIDELNELTLEVIYRGRWGSRMYEREPQKAQRKILNTASLLLHAVGLEHVSSQEDIPVLDLSSLDED